MRRLLATAALATVLVTVAACGSDDTPDASGGTPTASPTSAAAATSAADNTAEICANLEKASKDLSADMEAVTPKLSSAGSDPAKLRAVLGEFRTALTTFSATMRTEAAKAADPELKTSLETGAAAFESIAESFKDPQAIAQNPNKILEAFTSPEFEQAGESMEKFCG